MRAVRDRLRFFGSCLGVNVEVVAVGVANPLCLMGGYTGLEGEEGDEPVLLVSLLLVLKTVLLL